MNIRPESQLKFAKQGIYLTQQNIQMGNMDERERQEAIAWLAEEEHKATRREAGRYQLMLGFTIIAAVAASIAAWPIIKEWFLM